MGNLRPGAWSFFSLDLTSAQARRQPLALDFNNDAGQGIVIASFGTYPSLLTANFTFRCSPVIAFALAQNVHVCLACQGPGQRCLRLQRPIWSVGRGGDFPHVVATSQKCSEEQG